MLSDEFDGFVGTLEGDRFLLMNDLGGGGGGTPFFVE